MPPLHVQRLQALAQICRRFGGQLRLVSKNEFFTLLAANDDVKMPHTAGSLPEYATHWERKIVYALHGTKHVGYLIHEIGHVFADRHHPDSDKCDEWAWLGWEIAVACSIGAWAVWSQQNGNYGMGDGTSEGVGKNKDWRELSAKERAVIARDRLAHAKKLGTLSKRGVPRSVR
jgi:hypothetical protein